MNKRHSSILLATVFVSFGFSVPNSYAQLVINPTPLATGEVTPAPMLPMAMDDVPEPEQSTLMEPIDISEQKLREERALLNSIVVPEPGSSYFEKDGAAPSVQPMEMSEDTAAPNDSALMSPSEESEREDEYERWAAEQRTKYKAQNQRQEGQVPQNYSVRAHDSMMPMTPVEARDEPVSAQPPSAAPPSQQRPMHYHAQDRMSSSPELNADVQEIGVPSAAAYQPQIMQLDWNALEGSSVRQVLEGWSSYANVELIWQGPSDFAVINPFVMRSTYERAVQKLLDQYQHSQLRPVGTLYVDPDTGVKTLVVRVEG